MATSQTAPRLQPELLARIEEARGRTDALFQLLLPDSLYERPVAERHRLIFYVGHLEAFDWNLLGPTLGLTPHDQDFDKLFAFGIDPVDGGLPTDTPADWPTISQVEDYVRTTRQRLDENLRDPRALRSGGSLLTDGTLLHVAIEHRLMHAETLAYLMHNLPLEKKISQMRVAADRRVAPKNHKIVIPAGIATLGQSRTGPGTFGWDNEFDAQQIPVREFSIDAFPVTNSEYIKFVHAGGYENPAYWNEKDWQWKQAERLEHPHFWVKHPHSTATGKGTLWEYRAMFGNVPLPMPWPVYVSHAEATAFARWAGKKLPSEAQWHRAAYGTPEGAERQFPWGDSAPDASRGNFHHRRWDPNPVDAHPKGASAFGVHDLLGNGWEWTSTPFAPLPGFEPFPFYKGYSANFFDGHHFVMKGGSSRTDECMLRRSFRNWFQPHYPYLYATFRCVEE
jgi:ergothioneine biosynthesis protein EgtB